MQCNHLRRKITGRYSACKACKGRSFRRNVDRRWCLDRSRLVTGRDQSEKKKRAELGARRRRIRPTKKRISLSLSVVRESSFAAKLTTRRNETHSNRIETNRIESNRIPSPVPSPSPNLPTPPRPLSPRSNGIRSYVRAVAVDCSVECERVTRATSKQHPREARDKGLLTVRMRTLDWSGGIGSLGGSCWTVIGDREWLWLDFVGRMRAPFFNQKTPLTAQAFSTLLRLPLARATNTLFARARPPTKG